MLIVSINTFELFKYPSTFILYPTNSYLVRALRGTPALDDTVDLKFATQRNNV